MNHRVFTVEAHPNQKDSMTTRLALISLVLAACGPARGSPDRTGRAAEVAGLTGAAAPQGKTVYDANCAGCHGDKGQGGRGRSLTGFNGLTDVEVATVVLNGQGQMAAQPGLTNQQIADLIAHGRATFK